MTKLSLAASRTLVSFGVVALASTGVMAASINNTPTAAANAQFDANGKYTGKDNAGQAIAAGTNVELTLNNPTKIGTTTSFNGIREEERYFKGSGIGVESGTGFAAWGNGATGSVVHNPNSKVEIKLEANAVGTKGALIINGAAANQQTLYNFTLDADSVNIGDKQAINLEANNGVSSITANNPALDAVNLNTSNLTLGKNGSLEVTGSSFTMGAGAITIENAKSSKGITIKEGSTATFTNTTMNLVSDDIKQLRFDDANGGAKTLITLNPTGNTDTGTLAGVGITKNAQGVWVTNTVVGKDNHGRVAVAAGNLNVVTSNLERTASQLLQTNISKGLDETLRVGLTGTDSNLAAGNLAVGATAGAVLNVTGTDRNTLTINSTGANRYNTLDATGFIDYTTAGEVKYGYDAKGNYIKYQTKTQNVLDVNNGLYVQGNQVKLSSYLVRSLVNGKWVANINNINKLIAANINPLTAYQDILAGTATTTQDRAVLRDTLATKQTIVNDNVSSRLKELYVARDKVLSDNGITADVTVGTNDAQRNDVDRRALVAKINAQGITEQVKAALENDLKKFDEFNKLITEARDLYNKTGEKLDAYTRLLQDTVQDAAGNTQYRYFKTYQTVENGRVTGIASTGKLNTTGINKIADEAGVNSHRNLAVGVFDSLQESGLNELAIFNIQQDGLGSGRQWQTMTNEIHDSGRSVTNFTNSVNTTIQVSNELTLGDRIAKAHNPYGEKLAAAGSDVYSDFYRRTNGSVWANAFGGANIVDGESGGVYGISFGADKQITDSALLGIYFTYADSDLKDKGAKQESDNFRLGIYSNIQLSPSWELNLHGFGQLSQTDQYTTILNQGYTSDFDKKFFGLSGSVGRILDFENSLYLKPFAGLNYYYSNNPGYTEKGGDYIQNVDKTQNNTISLDVGLEVRKYFNETSYLFATPKIEQYLLNDGDDYSARFRGSPVSFSVKASDELKTYGQLVVGGSFGVSENLNIDLGLGAKQILANKVDDKNETYLSGNLGVRYKF